MIVVEKPDVGLVKETIEKVVTDGEGQGAVGASAGSA